MLEEWKKFDELEPGAAIRADWGFAHIVQALIGGGKPLFEFMLPFGDYEKPKPEPQTIAYQEMVIDAWIAGSNAMFAKKNR